MREVPGNASPTCQLSGLPDTNWPLHQEANPGSSPLAAGTHEDTSWYHRLPVHRAKDSSVLRTTTQGLMKCWPSMKNNFLTIEVFWTTISDCSMAGCPGIHHGELSASIRQAEGTEYEDTASCNIAFTRFLNVTDLLCGLSKLPRPWELGSKRQEGAQGRRGSWASTHCVSAQVSSFQSTRSIPGWPIKSQVT